MHKQILLLIMLLFSSGAYIKSQSCGEVINDVFDTDGPLPAEWVEYNTTGQVTVIDGEMVFDFTASKPAAQRSFTAVSGEFNYSFKMKSQRNWFKAQMNLFADNGDVIAGFLFGNDGNKEIYYASALDDSNNPTTFIPVLGAQFASNTEYLILLVVNAENKTFDLFINGELKASSLQFLGASNNLAKIGINSISMYGGSGKLYFDNIQITRDNVIRVNLESAIANAQSFLDNVTVGTGNGEYTQSAVDDFQSKINEASAILVDCNASQEDIDEAIVNLQIAQTDFENTQNWGEQEISITIDPKTVLCDKNPLWFGGNNTYNGSGQGLWDSANGRCHYNVIDLANYTGAQGYRFPGGTMANLYRWKRAIGPVDERIDNMNSHGAAGPLSNEFGPDEFGQMLGNTHMDKGVIVVAFNWETPQDAADYVEYMNAEVGENPNGGIDWAQVRADNGRIEPYNIKYWEIGNELSGNWELSVCNYPSTGDANRGGDALMHGLVDVYVNGAPRSFTNQRATKESSWEEATCVVNGSANQEFYVKFCPVDLGKTFTLTINNTVWTRVDNFDNSAAGDLHYTVNAETGKISFGDGVNGSIPSGGYNVFLDYSTDQIAGFPEYYAAMKAVDPSIEVISCWEGEAFYREMAEINSPYDGVTKHYYPGGSADEADVYKQVMKNSVGYKSKITQHLTYLSKYDNSSLAGINVKQHLTEFFGGKNIDVVTQHCIMWHDIINYHPEDVGNVMVHSYFKNDNTPMVNTGGNFVAAKGLPYHIFTHLHQSSFVKTNYDGGSYTFNNASIQNSYPTASTNEAGNVITLVVPNTRDEDRLITDITIQNYEFGDAKVIGKKWEAKAFDIFKENTSADPFAVRVDGPIDFELGRSITDTIAPFSVAIYQWVVEEQNFLSDLDETAIGSEIKKDEGFSDDGIMKVNGITYEKGIGIKAGSSVTYDLKGQYLSFLTEFGLDDAFTGGEVKLLIYVDEELVYQSDNIGSNTPSPKLNIDVTDAETLRIEAHSTFNSNGEGNITLGNARLIIGELDNSIESKKKETYNIQAYPNPFQSQFRVDLPIVESGKLMLVDMRGNIQYSMEVEHTKSININHLSIPSGAYAIMFYGKETVYVGKVLKK